MGDENFESYAVFSFPTADLSTFVSSNALDLSPRAQDGGVQHDIASQEGWPIADLPYFSKGLVGQSGMRVQGQRGFQLTLDERDTRMVTVYLYSDGG